MKKCSNMIKRCRLYFSLFFAIVGVVVSPQALAVLAAGAIQPVPSDSNLSPGEVITVELFLVNASVDTPPDPILPVDATLGGTTVVTLACADSACATELPGTLVFQPVGGNGCVSSAAGVVSCAANGLNKVDITITPNTIPIPAGGAVSIATIQVLAQNAVLIPADGEFNLRADTEPNDITACRMSDPNDTCVTGGGQGSTALFFPGTCEVDIEKCVRVDIDGDGVFEDEICFGSGDLVDVAALGLLDKHVEWVIDYANTGDQALDECILIDESLGLNVPIGALSPEQSDRYIAEGQCTETGLFNNTAQIICGICADQVQDPPISDSDSASLECVTCQPEIDKKVTCSAADPSSETNPENWVEECTGWEGTEEVAYRIALSNPNGDFSVDAVECFVADPKVGFAESGITLPAGGEPLVRYSDVEFCTDPGVNTSTVSCLCSTQTGDGIRDELLPPYFGTLALDETQQFEIPDDCAVGDEDSADLNCEAVGLDVTKECLEQDDQGVNIVNVHVENNGLAENPGVGVATLTNCQLTDPLINGDPLTPNPINDVGPGVTKDATGTIVGLTQETVNEVSVTCDIVGAFDNDGNQKTVTDNDTDPCEVPGEGCWTRTPGYWATHMDEAQETLNLGVPGEINCGIGIYETDASDGSTVQDMCSIGKDPASFNDGKTISPQLAQLTRQCMAAQLNLAITEAFEGDCNGTSGLPSDTTAILGFCCGIGEEVGEYSVCNPPAPGVGEEYLGACIGFVDYFNNFDDEEFESENDICEYFDGAVDCNAEPKYCQDAKNDCTMNTGRAQRELLTDEECEVKGGKKK